VWRKCKFYSLKVSKECTIQCRSLLNMWRSSLLPLQIGRQIKFTAKNKACLETLTLQYVGIERQIPWILLTSKSFVKTGQIMTSRSTTTNIQKGSQIPEENTHSSYSPLRAFFFEVSHPRCVVYKNVLTCRTLYLVNPTIFIYLCVIQHYMFRPSMWPSSGVSRS